MKIEISRIKNVERNLEGHVTVLVMQDSPENTPDSLAEIGAEIYMASKYTIIPLPSQDKGICSLEMCNINHSEVFVLAKKVGEYLLIEVVTGEAPMPKEAPSIDGLLGLLQKHSGWADSITVGYQGKCVSILGENLWDSIGRKKTSQNGDPILVTEIILSPEVPEAVKESLARGFAENFVKMTVAVTDNSIVFKYSNEQHIPNAVITYEIKDDNDLHLMYSELK